MASFLQNLSNNVGGNQSLINATKPAPPNTGDTRGGFLDLIKSDTKNQIKDLTSNMLSKNIVTDKVAPNLTEANIGGISIQEPIKTEPIALPDVKTITDEKPQDLKEVGIGGIQIGEQKLEETITVPDTGVVTDEKPLDLKEVEVGPIEVGTEGIKDVDLKGQEELNKAKDFLTSLLEGKDVFEAEHNKAMQDLQNMNASQMNVMSQQMAQQGISGDNALIFKMMQNRGFSANQAGMLASFSSDLAKNKMTAASQLANIGLSEMGIDLKAKQQEINKLQAEKELAMKGSQFDKSLGLQKDQLEFNKMIAQKELEMKKASQNAAMWAADLATYDPSTKEGMNALKQSWTNLFGDKPFPANIHEVALDAAFNKSVADGMTYVGALPGTIGPDGKAFKESWLEGGWKDDSKFVNDAEKAFANAHGGEGKDVYGEEYVDKWIQDSFLPMLDKTPENETIATLTGIITNQPNWDDLTEEQKQNALDDIEMFVKLGGQSISVDNEGNFTIFDSEGNSIYNSGGKDAEESTISGDFDFDDIKTIGGITVETDPVTDESIKTTIGNVSKVIGDSNVDYDTKLVNIDKPQMMISPVGGKSFGAAYNRINSEYQAGGFDSLSEGDKINAIKMGIHVPEGGLKFHYDAKNDQWVNTNTNTVVTNKDLNDKLSKYKPTGDEAIDPTEYLKEDDIYFENGEYKIVTEGTGQSYNPFDEITRIDDKSIELYNNLDSINGITDAEKDRLKTHIEGVLGSEWAAGGLSGNDLKSSFQNFGKHMSTTEYSSFLKNIGKNAGWDNVTEKGLTQVEGGAGGSTSGSSAWIEFQGFEGKTSGDMVMYFGRPTMIYKNPTTVDIKGNDNERVYYLQDAVTGQKFQIQTNKYADQNKAPDEKFPSFIFIKDDGSYQHYDKDNKAYIDGDWVYKKDYTGDDPSQLNDGGWLNG